MDVQRKQEVNAISRRIPDPLGGTDDQKEKMTSQQRLEHEERLEAYFIANRADPDYLNKGLRSRFYNEVPEAECSFPPFHFNNGAEIDLESFEANATERFVEWLIKYNELDGR